MKTETMLLLEKASRSLEAARCMHKNGDHDFAASRAYYAMFYAAEAALLENGESYSKHAGVISGFYQQFVATGKLSQELHQNLHNAFEDRAQADYAFLDPFPESEAAQLLQTAAQFLEQVAALLKQHV